MKCSSLRVVKVSKQVTEQHDAHRLTSLDGFINIWNKSTAQCIQRLAAHSPRCNSVSWCPTNPQIFASCGDDGKIKMCVALVDLGPNSSANQA